MTSKRSTSIHRGAWSCTARGRRNDSGFIIRCCLRRVAEQPPSELRDLGRTAVRRASHSRVSRRFSGSRRRGRKVDALKTQATDRGPQRGWRRSCVGRGSGRIPRSSVCQGETSSSEAQVRSSMAMTRACQQARDADDHDEHELRLRCAASARSRITSAQALSEVGMLSRAAGTAASRCVVSSDVLVGTTSGMSTCCRSGAAPWWSPNATVMTSPNTRR